MDGTIQNFTLDMAADTKKGSVGDQAVRHEQPMGAYISGSIQESMDYPVWMSDTHQRPEDRRDFSQCHVYAGN